MRNTGGVGEARETQTYLDARARSHPLLDVVHDAPDVREHEHRDQYTHHGECDRPEPVARTIVNVNSKDTSSGTYRISEC